jgi:hypothetical protein
MLALVFAAATRVHAGQGPVDTSFDPATGIYQITDRATGWSFVGQANGQVADLGGSDGHDNIGSYHDIAFMIDVGGQPARATIRAYDDIRGVKFRLEYRKARSGNGVNFPDFGAFPAHLHTFSYRDSSFAPATYGLVETATPWLLFDDLGRSVIISPAAEFMVSRMVGDAKTSISEGFDPRLKQVPAGFAQESLLVFADHVSDAWRTWGGAMRKLFAHQIPKPDSDPLLKSFGYWTDNGADYYYNYDLDKGYAGTLLAVRDQYRAEGIPLGYVQLDSWWYPKTIDDPSGKPGGATKNSKLPAEPWNRYGGLYQYRADTDLFPSGLPAFEKQLGLPLAVHNRWMDRHSPYHDAYKISGVAVTDPKWWRETATYLAGSGVSCYEQDWLDPIYEYSPDMAGQPAIGEAFADDMAQAMRQRGITMQYCMAPPRFYLQGLHYPNLTTIRTSGDRFEPRKWAEFLYGSQFAEAVGIWPWCDVFKSAETGNMILAVLSGGPVGTGDALGKESKDNILKAALPNGTIVKPDAPLLPCDQTYMDAANRRPAPFWASTYTAQADSRTVYLFGFQRSEAVSTWSLHLRDLGMKGYVYLFDPLAGVGRRVHADETLEVSPSGHANGYDFAYLIAAPYMSSGIALVGDLGKWAPTGRQRIEEITDRRDALRVRVLFAPKEGPITLDGASPASPVIRVAGPGRASLRSYDPATQRWTADVAPAGNGRAVEVVMSGPPPAAPAKPAKRGRTKG